jgi:hypothetical protein
MGSMSGPSVKISRSLQPDLKDFSFEKTNFIDGLKEMGVSDETIDRLTVRFCNSKTDITGEQPSRYSCKNKWFTGAIHIPSIKSIFFPRSSTTTLEKPET